MESKFALEGLSGIGEEKSRRSEPRIDDYSFLGKGGREVIGRNRKGDPIYAMGGASDEGFSLGGLADRTPDLPREGRLRLGGEGVNVDTGHGVGSADEDETGFSIGGLADEPGEDFAADEGLPDLDDDEFVDISGMSPEDLADMLDLGSDESGEGELAWVNDVLNNLREKVQEFGDKYLYQLILWQIQQDLEQNFRLDKSILRKFYFFYYLNVKEMFLK